MIRHVFTLAWKRKRINALLITELLVAFLVLFTLAGFSLHALRLYRVPLGFDFTHAWAVNLTTGNWEDARDALILQQVMVAVKALNEVEAVHIMSNPPFQPGSGGYIRFGWNGRRIDTATNTASDGLLEALGVQLLEGRWFGPQDEGQAVTPILITRAFDDALGQEEVLGVEIDVFGNQRMRVIGVIDDFRLDGEFSPVAPAMFRQNNVGTNNPSLTVLLKSGVTAAFEEELLEVMLGIAPQWDFDVKPWASLRRDNIRANTLPLLAGGLLVAFLLILVGCGMLGVLWQNIIRRMPEMGLRRAVGATAGAVRLQVVLELIAMTCMALVLGFVIVVQIPLSGMWPILDWELFIRALITSTLVLLAACALFALYPSYQATRRDPVDALRYE